MRSLSPTNFPCFVSLPPLRLGSCEHGGRRRPHLKCTDQRTVSLRPRIALFTNKNTQLRGPLCEEVGSLLGENVSFRDKFAKVKPSQTLSSVFPSVVALTSSVQLRTLSESKNDLPRCLRISTGDTFQNCYYYLALRLSSDTPKNAIPKFPHELRHASIFHLRQLLKYVLAKPRASSLTEPLDCVLVYQCAILGRTTP
ncbi:hypothetical protein NDU88_007664 [Pleurodeles waltl]|uniref:Uncharacterized protein n=1 Tax=Pleurodeles waltl TaxID=8319 RepID=A0AAV7QLF8_PLEWA|nr:hypothetical protein NDU88_007664 [Pleurodeles waltl]